MTENVKGFAKLVGVPKMTESERFMVEDLARSWLTPADMPYGVKTLLLSKDGVSGYKILYDGAGKYWRIRHNREEAKYTSPKEKPAQRFMPRDLAAFSKAKIVGIVEGEKKAAAALRFAGLPAIGIGGCWNWCESTEDREAKQICLEILDNVTPDQVILCCLDGDWRNNENVQRAVATLALELEALGLHAHFPDFGNAGGLDDWIIAKYERKENVPEPEQVLKDILFLPKIPLETLETAKNWALASLAKFNSSHVGLSDLGNATLMLRLTGKDNLRYMEDAKKWAEWDKDIGRWGMLSPKHLEHANCVAHHYEKLAQRLRELAEAIPEADARRNLLVRRAAATAKWANNKCASVSGREQILKDAGGRPGVICSRKDFDKDPDLLGVANGVVDLRTGELAKERQADMILNHAPTRYTGHEPSGPGALKAKKLVREITALTHGNPAPDRERYLQRRLGAALRGRNQLDSLELFVGKGANGKTVLSKLVAAALGDYAGTIPAGVMLTTRANRDSEAASPFLTSTIGRRILFASETSDTAHLEEAKVKQLTGGDKLSVRGNYQNPTEYDVTWTLFLLTNNRPHVAQGDLALWDRLAVFPFMCRWRRENAPEGSDEVGLPLADTTLRDLLFNDADAQEWILWWIIQGGVDYQTEGIGAVPADIVVNRGEYQEAEDKLGHWMEDVGVTLEVEGRTLSGLA